MIMRKDKKDIELIKAFITGKFSFVGMTQNRSLRGGLREN